MLLQDMKTTAASLLIPESELYIEKKRNGEEGNKCVCIGDRYKEGGNNWWSTLTANLSSEC